MDAQNCCPELPMVPGTEEMSVQAIGLFKERGIQVVEDIDLVCRKYALLLHVGDPRYALAPRAPPDERYSILQRCDLTHTLDERVPCKAAVDFVRRCLPLAANGTCS